MHTCNICNKEIKELGEKNVNHHSHILVSKSMIDGHIHVHGDLGDKDTMKELLSHGQAELGIDPTVKAELTRKEIVFKNRQRIGDMLMFTCGVRDFKRAFSHVRINVVAIAGHIFDHNPHIDRTLEPTPENLVEVGPSKLTNKSNTLDWHFANAFRMSMEDALKVSIPQGESRPDIWFTKEEWDAPRIFEQPYWIISTTGEKGWGCKMYPTNKWQEVIDQNPDITFVQIGTAEDNAPRLKGSNVIDHVGKTQSRDNGIRDLFKLFLNAEGSIGLVSFHMHLSGALYKPSVVIAGAREPVSFTRYAGHAYLSNDGALPCAVKACWHCSIDACTNLVIREETVEKKIPKCVDIIESEDVTRAIRSYYKGGRLDFKKPSDKPKLFRNIVPTPPKVVVAPEPVVNTYGMKFGGGSLTDRDWTFISNTMAKYKIKSVLEFGAGLSTLLFNDTCAKVMTFEAHPGWIKRIQDLNPKCKIEFWDGVTLNGKGILRLFDLAFVDGPAGDQPREASTHLASMYANYVIVHDAGREWARKYQDQYLKPDFDGPIKGGHRCHLWIRKGCEVGGDKQTTKGQPHATASPLSSTPAVSIAGCEATPVASARKFIKIVSTARGYGGCARSVTTIMKFLLQQGHRVQFIPFRNSVGSKELQEMFKTDLKDVDVALGYGPVKEACDTLLMYADDYVWEFNKPEVAEVFAEINATKKVMMLNYRRGPVGSAPWTRGWDQYLFLCSMQEKELLSVYPMAQGKTKVLAPCTILDPFLKVTPNYQNGVRIVRHNSQGDSKFIGTNFSQVDCEREIVTMLEARSDLSMAMLPGPSFMPQNSRFVKVARTANPFHIADFLSGGNLFWYSLPYGYTDMGPRVILEAMAAGLPVLADDWSGGAADRVTPETGWVLPKKQWLPIIRGLDAKTLERMGTAAKERAYSEFRPEKWMEVLLS